MINFNDFKYTEWCKSFEDGSFTKWKIISEDDLNREIRESYGKRYNIFSSVYWYNKPELSSSKIGDFHMDFDSEHNIEAAREDASNAVIYFSDWFQCSPDYFQIGFSGKKGFYVIIPKENFFIKPIKNIHEVYKKVIEMYVSDYKTLDRGIYGNRRMWRINNTCHLSTGKYKINLTFNELKTMSIEDIKKKADSPRYLSARHDIRKGRGFFSLLQKMRRHINKDDKKAKERAKNYKGTTNTKVSLDNMPVKYKHLVSMTSEGNRNPTITSLVGLFKKCGLTKDECEQEILEFNRRYCRPPKTDDEALKPVEYYYSR